MTHINLFDSSSNLNLIVKTPGIACNLNCSYCFEKVKLAPKEFISPSILEDAINKISNTCSIVFHGGEPLLIGIPNFRRLLETVKPYYPKKVIAVRVQTNGTLLNEEWIALLFEEYKELKIEIAISLDGTSEMNKLRIDNNNIPSFQKVIDAFNLLELHNISAGMLSVISRHSLDCSKEYIELINLMKNLRFVKINGLFNVINDRLSVESITPSEYAEFLIKVSNVYIHSGLYRSLPIEPLLSIFQRLNSKPSRYCNYSPRKCFNYVSLYPNGTISPCDCFSVDEFFISSQYYSNINKAMESYANSEKCRELIKIISMCNNCEIREFCMGGCLSQRYYFRNNNMLIDDYCKAKFLLFEHFKRMMEIK